MEVMVVEEEEVEVEAEVGQEVEEEALDVEVVMVVKVVVEVERARGRKSTLSVTNGTRDPSPLFISMELHGLAVNFVFILKKDASFSTCDDAGGSGSVAAVGCVSVCGECAHARSKSG